MGTLDNYRTIEILNVCGKLDISCYIIAVFRGHLFATEEKTMKKLICYQILPSSVRKIAEGEIQLGSIYGLAATENNLYALIREDVSRTSDLLQCFRKTIHNMTIRDKHRRNKRCQWAMSKESYTALQLNGFQECHISSKKTLNGSKKACVSPLEAFKA